MEQLFQSKLKTKTSMDITPLVDIIFLLVAFFMLTSSLGKDYSIFVDLPKAEHRNVQKNADIIVSIAEDGSIYVNKQKLDAKEWKKDLKRTMRKLWKKKDKQKVIIRGDKKSPYERIVDLMDTLSAAGITNFALAVSVE